MKKAITYIIGVIVIISVGFFFTLGKEKLQQTPNNHHEEEVEIPDKSIRNEQGHLTEYGMELDQYRTFYDKYITNKLIDNIDSFYVILERYDSRMFIAREALNTATEDIHENIQDFRYYERDIEIPNVFSEAHRSTNRALNIYEDVFSEMVFVVETNDSTRLEELLLLLQEANQDISDATYFINSTLEK